MPRTAEEILAHADKLARRFEAEPDPDQIRDATTLREVARAFEARARAEADLASAVATARADGHTWAAIGAMLGTSGEAARQRYGTPPRESEPFRNFVVHTPAGGAGSGAGRAAGTGRQSREPDAGTPGRRRA
jgi:hypothetical protein